MELISENKIHFIAGQQRKDPIMIEKDYFLTLFLYFIQDKSGIYFKGGTALNKIFLEQIRLSEDLDFTITIPMDNIKGIVEEIISNNKNIFTKLTYDKRVYGFTRYLLYYKSYFREEALLLLDFNKRAKLSLPPEKHPIPNFYELLITVNTLNKKELIAEKVCALINRNKARDYFDVYHIIKKGIPIDVGLVKEKSKLHHQEFDNFKIFNQANKVYRQWENDLSPLTTEAITFQEVMKTLKEYFNYVAEKKKRKMMNIYREA
ncbi:nucleotidyl transferase AbiEii/AbiGii toxin family protein [Candidatus Woesearchaeota archaeon]|nr:nucleotidyl transferase AbiEii/AbiGii toxin family protein [Candidatus Woesearchaeota archaeon]